MNLFTLLGGLGRNLTPSHALRDSVMGEVKH